MKQDCITYVKKDGHCTKFNHLCTNPYSNECCYFYLSEKHEENATNIALSALRVEVNRLNKRINQIEDEVKELHNKTIGNRKYYGSRNDYVIVKDVVTDK